MLYITSLSESNRAALTLLAQNGSPSLRRRAQIVLLSADGKSVPDIARKVGLHAQNVRKWLHRYRAEGIGGLQHRSAGQSRNIKHSADTKRRIAGIAASNPLDLGLSFNEWSLPKLRRYLVDQGIVPSISIETIRTILRAHGVHWRRNPHSTPIAGAVLSGRKPGPPHIAIHFDQQGRIAINDLTESDTPPDLDLLSEHHQKDASDIHLLYEPQTNAITLRLYRKRSNRKRKEG